MTTVAIRKKLASFMKVADDKKVKAVYALLENDIAQEELGYTKDFKTELDKRYSYYKNGGKMISAANADKQVNKLLQTSKLK